LLILSIQIWILPCSLSARFSKNNYKFKFDDKTFKGQSIDSLEKISPKTLLRIENKKDKKGNYSIILTKDKNSEIFTVELISKNRKKKVVNFMFEKVLEIRVDKKFQIIDETKNNKEKFELESIIIKEYYGDTLIYKLEENTDTIKSLQIDKKKNYYNSRDSISVTKKTFSKAIYLKINDKEIKLKRTPPNT